jgi:hypothetical protein
VTQKRKKTDAPKKGRPKLPDGTAKSAIVKARFSPEEHTRIEAAATRDGISKTEWVRKTLLSAA